MGRKPIVGIFSVGLEEPYRWKDSVQSPAEFSLWAADGMANGLRPWFTKFSGTLHDPRWSARRPAELYDVRVFDLVNPSAPLSSRRWLPIICR